MRLVYLTLEAPREGNASYTHVHEIIKGLKQRGWVVELYEPSYTAKASSPSLFIRLILSLTLQLRLWIEWEKGSILYIRGHYLAFPSALVAKLFRLPIYHEINGPYDDVFIVYPVLNRVRPILIWMQRMQYRWSTGLIAVTQALCEWVSKECNIPPAKFIPNGANTDLFYPGHPRPGDLPENYAIFFGGLAKWHRIATAIDAIDLPLWPQNVDLVIIGDGPERELVKAAAQKNSKIHALGRKPYKDIPAYAANAFCGLVLTADVTEKNDMAGGSGQRSETGLFPLKLFETLACGIPAIVTDFPGQADMIRDGQCGLVIPADDASALARAVATLAADPDTARSMGQRGRDLVVARHSWDARADQTDQLIRAYVKKN